MCHHFTATFIKSFIKKVQKAKYSIVLMIIITGKAANPIKPADKNILTIMTSIIMANNNRCPMGCE